MEVHARPPPPLPEHGNSAENWIKWRKEFQLFMDLTKESYVNQEALKGKLLLNLIGRVGLDALEKIDFDRPEDKEDMDTLLKKFEEYFNPPKNEIIGRYHFFKKEQGNNETFQNYVKDLKKKAKKCKFGELEESLIRDKIILSVKDETLLKKIFDTNELDLQKVISIVVANQSSMKPVTKEKIIEKNVKIQNIEKPNKTQNTEKYDKPQNTEKCDKPQNTVKNDKSQNELSNLEKLNLNKKQKVCWRCNNEHKMGTCPAYTSLCNGCGLKGHIQSTNACRIAFLKKKQFEDKRENPENIHSRRKQLNLNINHPEVKTENCTYQRHSIPGPPPVPPQYNMLPSAPELSALYPNLPTVHETLQPNFTPPPKMNYYNSDQRNVSSASSNSQQSWSWFYHK